MKDPRIRVEGEHGTILSLDLWDMIREWLHQTEYSYTGDIKIYLDDVEVDEQIEMEDGEEENG